MTRLIGRSFGFPLLLMLAGVSSGEVSLADAPWGEAGTFPHEIVELLHHGAELSTENAETLRERAKEIVATKDRLQELQKATEGQRVRARLSVMKVTAKEVHLLPDVTSGFPTLAVEEVQLPGLRPIHSAVRLQETNVAEPTKQLVLRIGESIPADVAKRLLWNDKVLVDFQVDAITINPPVPKWVDDYGHSSDWPIIDPAHVYCTVGMSDLRFLSVEMPKLISSHRTRLWPGPGTFPFIVQQIEQDPSTSTTDRQMKKAAFLDYASLYPIKGAALFELWVVTEHEGVRLWGSPLSGPRAPAPSQFLEKRGPTGRSSLQFGERGTLGQYENYLKLDHGLFTDQQLRDMSYVKGQPRRKRDLVLLHFDQTVVKLPNSHEWIIEYGNFRVGSDNEHVAAERLVEEMPKRSEQYALAVASERERRIEETARKLLAEEEAKRKAESFTAQAQMALNALRSPETATDDEEQQLNSDVEDGVPNQNPPSAGGDDAVEELAAEAMPSTTSYGQFLWIGAGGAVCLLVGLAAYTQRHRFAGQGKTAHNASSPQRRDPFA
ncbi:hypothetical protein [Lacipirellula limnantheis]|uniref:Uncharacterized protein n=1 Tax=Lacipirellula limnantheis TaxID=2528024 RepID=A0A517U6U7_9BACT|nr:hypothetical protein [Lacipirellula limnantheis]QDT76359.1 hypothetical protein I41_56090 [Lacipirellula limnantheis]